MMLYLVSQAHFFEQSTLHFFNSVTIDNCIWRRNVLNEYRNPTTVTVMSGESRLYFLYTNCIVNYENIYCVIVDNNYCEQCEHFCYNNSKCGCNDGYTLSTDKHSCIKCADLSTTYLYDSARATWHVTICNKNDQSLVCNGNLINDQWIVTSAKCVCNVNVSSLSLLSLASQYHVLFRKMVNLKSLHQKYTVIQIITAAPQLKLRILY